MGRGNRHLKRFTSWLVLVSFLASLMSPIVEGAALIPVKVPGRQVLFDVNSATAQELATIPGIGPKTAAEIVRYRAQFGPFKTIQDVGNVRGVGKARIAKLTSAATQGARPDLKLRTYTKPQVEQTVVKPVVETKTVSTVSSGLAKTLQPVWVTGSNGVKVNVNVPSTKVLVANLSKAGFTDTQVNTIANSRLMSDTLGKTLTLKPFTSIADVQARLNASGSRGILDARGVGIAAPVEAPAAPISEPAVKVAPSKGLVYANGERLMFRVNGGSKTVFVNLNQQSATGLYKQLRAAGLPADTAKSVAQARIKGSFKSYQDLLQRVPTVEKVAKAPISRSSVTAPAEGPKAPVSQKAAPTFETEMAKLAKQHQAIANRTPSSATGYDRTVKSLQDTYDAMFKQVAQKTTAQNPAATPETIAKDPRLQKVAKDIDFFNKGKANLAKAQTLNKAKASLDTEIAKYSKQAEAVQARTPTSAKGYDTTVESLKATYKDLYSRLEMRAKLEGKANPQELVKDPRLVKLSESIDSVKTAKSDFLTQKAANVEQAKANAGKATVKTAKIATNQGPAAPEENAVAKTEVTAPKTENAPAASETAAAASETPAAPAFKSKAEYTARINDLSARTKALFGEIKAESGGVLTNNKDVWDAARHYQGEGKLAELRKSALELQNLRSNRVNQYPPEQKQVASKPAESKPAEKAVQKTKASAPAKQNAPAAPAEQPVAEQPATNAKALSPTKQLSSDAKALTAKLVQDGKFSTTQEAYQASEKPGATGELAQLKTINDQIRANRAAGKAAPTEAPAPVKETVATEPAPANAKVAASETAAPGQVQAPAETPVAPKAKWTDGFLKAVKGGQFKSTEGGWADSYLKVLKGENAGGGTVAEQPAAPAEGIGRASETAGAGEAPVVAKPAPSGGWADDYLATLKGEKATAGGAQPSAKGGWLQRLFSRKTAPAPATEAPAGDTVATEGQVAEAPAQEPAASDTAASETVASQPAKSGDVNTQIKDLQGQAYSLKAKIKESGQFANNADIYKASEADGASGDLAQLKSINDQIRGLRTSKKVAVGSAPAETPNPSQSAEAKAAAPTEQAPESVAAAPKKGGFFSSLKDWFLNKNTLYGKAKAAKAAAAQQGEAQDAAVAPAETPSETPAAGESAVAAPKKGGFFSGLKDWFLNKNTLYGKAKAAKAAGVQTEGEAAPSSASEAAVPADAKASSTAQEPAPTAKGSAAEPAQVAEIPAEPEVAKSPAVQKIDAIDSSITNLRTQQHDISAGLVKEGSFKNAGEVIQAAEQPGASGKVAEVGKINESIKSLQTEKVTVAKAAEPAPAAASEAAPAPAATETPAQAAPAAETPAGAKVPGASNAAISGAAAPAAEAAIANGFAVKFGSKTQDLGQMTAKQIETETGGLVNGDAAQKIADTAKANGGKISVNDLSKLGLTDDVVSTLKKGNTEAVTGQLQDARAKAVEKYGADSEAVKKIDSNLEQVKGSQGQSSESPAAPSKGFTDLLSARTTQLDGVNAQIAKLESSTGLLAKFTKGKQLKALYEQKSNLEKEISSYKNDPKSLEQASAAYQQKNEKVFAEQAKQAGYLETELAKVDPNSRYGRALQERISQIKGTPPESFAKQTTNMFLIAAGTNIMLQLGRQLKNGEKLDIASAIKSVANPQFLLGTLGSAVGAYAGTQFAVSKLGLILTTKLGAFLPPIGRVFLQMLPAMAGGAIGGTLLGG
ncbi:MAG: helix-hairpin-helix domain-containing protein, partial [Candidatus Wallbacteria bacterium]|nr:helix-hairpin-helix domain-containing protein [Candidatus Wallbacteria bacterium]